MYKRDNNVVVHSISIRTEKIYEVTELLYSIAVFLNTCNTNLQYFYPMSSASCTFIT